MIALLNVSTLFWIWRRQFVRKNRYVKMEQALRRKKLTRDFISIIPTPQKSFCAYSYPAQISVSGRKASHIPAHTSSSRIGYINWFSVSSLPVSGNGIIYCF